MKLRFEILANRRLAPGPAIVSLTFGPFITYLHLSAIDCYENELICPRLKYLFTFCSSDSPVLISQIASRIRVIGFDFLKCL